MLKRSFLPLLLLLECGLQASWHFPPTDFSQFDSFFSFDVKVAADNGGNATAVWVESLDVPSFPPGEQQVIRASIFSNAGDAWGTPTTISIPNPDGTQVKEFPDV